jgi:hypothetical protein
MTDRTTRASNTSKRRYPAVPRNRNRPRLRRIGATPGVVERASSLRNPGHPQTLGESSFEDEDEDEDEGKANEDEREAPRPVRGDE